MKKKPGKLFIDLFEIVIPTIMFGIIFVVFIVAIVFRYFVKQPISWTYDLSILAFMWCAYFACGYAMRDNGHVMFTIVYDHLPPKGQKICRYITNIIISSAMLISIVPCYKTLMKNVSFTGNLMIPNKIAFFPLIIMFINILIRSIHQFILELGANRKS